MDPGMAFEPPVVLSTRTPVISSRTPNIKWRVSQYKRFIGSKMQMVYLWYLFHSGSFWKWPSKSCWTKIKKNRKTGQEVTEPLLGINKTTKCRQILDSENSHIFDSLKSIYAWNVRKFLRLLDNKDSVYFIFNDLIGLVWIASIMINCLLKKWPWACLWHNPDK